MCTGSRHSAPPPPAPRQAPRMPDMPTIAGNASETLQRRATLASMILTPAGGLGAASTAGKTVLGA